MSAMGRKQTSRRPRKIDVTLFREIMRRSFALFAAATCFALWSVSAFAAPHVDPWNSKETGIRRAEAVIDRCFEWADSTPHAVRDACVRSAYEACEDEHGTSQHDITDCSIISAGAWEARIARALDRLATGRADQSRLRERFDQQRRDLVGSQRLWSEWNEAECKAQVGNDGGSMVNYDLYLCRSDHAALRAIELQYVVDWWLS
jgi:uncharacterized protein YecT (DUF1311 family)